MKHGLIILSLFIILVGCGKKETPQPVQDANIDTTAVAVEIPQLKSVTINADYIETKNKAVRIPTSQEVKAMFKQIFSKETLTDYYKDASLRIIDTLYISEKTKLLVVSRETENEIWAWLTQWDNQDKLVFSKLVLKDDYVESFNTVSTVIKDSTITITHIDTQQDANANLIETETIEQYVFTDKEEIHYFADKTDYGRVDFGDIVTRFVTEKVAKEDIYDVKSTVLIFPPFPEKTFEDENSEEAEGYFAMADDFSWYTAETSQHFEALGVKVETTNEKRYVRFQLENGKQVTVDMHREETWSALLYKKGKLPIKIYIVMNDLDTAEKYLKR
jgi:PBP1b-binding outer membrane lipoprotein LpoB